MSVGNVIGGVIVTGLVIWILFMLVSMAMM